MGDCCASAGTAATSAPSRVASPCAGGCCGSCGGGCAARARDSPARPSIRGRVRFAQPAPSCPPAGCSCACATGSSCASPSVAGGDDGGCGVGASTAPAAGSPVGGVTPSSRPSANNGADVPEGAAGGSGGRSGCWHDLGTGSGAGGGGPRDAGNAPAGACTPPSVGRAEKAAPAAGASGSRLPTRLTRAARRSAISVGSDGARGADGASVACPADGRGQAGTATAACGGSCSDVRPAVGSDEGGKRTGGSCGMRARAGASALRGCATAGACARGSVVARGAVAGSKCAVVSDASIGAPSRSAAVVPTAGVEASSARTVPAGAWCAPTCGGSGAANGRSALGRIDGGKRAAGSCGVRTSLGGSSERFGSTANVPLGARTPGSSATAAAPAPTPTLAAARAPAVSPGRALPPAAACVVRIIKAAPADARCDPSGRGWRAAVDMVDAERAGSPYAERAGALGTGSIGGLRRIVAVSGRDITLCWAGAAIAPSVPACSSPACAPSPLSGMRRVTLRHGSD